MSILFYKMPGCGWCDKAESVLSKEISSGEIIVKSYKIDETEMLHVL